MYVLALEEAREVETVGYAQTRHTAYHMVHHIARTGHDETYVGHALEHLGRSLDKVIGTLLIGDAAEERYDLVVDAALGGYALALGKAHGIVYRDNLVGRNAVAVDDDLAREVRHGNNLVGGHHARTLDGVGLGIDILTRTVVLRSVHVHHQRLARHTLGGNAGKVCQPVVGMDNAQPPP